MPDFTTDELEQLRDDIGTQMGTYGGTEAANVVPRGLLRRRVKEIADGNVEQTNRGLLGAGIGAVAGGGLGAVTTGLSKGISHAPFGLLGAIPGAASGYFIGKEQAQQKQLHDLLAQELGVKEGAIRSSLEPGFETILGELHVAKQTGKLDMSTFKSALKDLREGRGDSLKPSERFLLRKHILGQSSPRPGDIPPNWPKKPKASPAPTPTPAYPKPNAPAPKGSPAPLGFMKRLKKYRTPIALLGGAAALGALGLGVAAAKDKPSWEKDLTNKDKQAK